MEEKEQNGKKGGNPYLDELHKFIGKEATVTYLKGEKVAEIKGTVKGINLTYLSVAVMTDVEKVLLKHIIEIRRKRENPDKGSKKE